jgi:O-antigen/teichoic acid export membrane protein
MIIKKIKNTTILTKSNKNIFSVVVGTVLAQIIPVLISPVLTRIYTPEDFGVFAIYMSIVTISVTVASFRYDLAIFIPKNLDDSKRLVILSIFISCIFSIIFFIALLFLMQNLFTKFNLASLGGWLLTVPIIVLFISIYQIYTQWLNKIKNYNYLNFYRILNSGSISFLNILFGFLKLKDVGLILSSFITQAILATVSLYNIKSFFKFYNYSRIKILVSKYINFPKYTLPSTLGGEIASQMPTILLGYYFNQTIIGYYLLATKIITLPFTVIGNSIATVYRQEAIEEFNLNGNCKNLYIKTFKKLFFIGIIPVLILLFWGEFFFTFYFGSQWKIAGKIASYLSVMVFFQILSSPMADTILFINGQKIDFLLQFARLLFSILSFVIGGFLQNYELAIILFTITYSVYYILHSIFQFKIAKGAK